MTLHAPSTHGVSTAASSVEVQMQVAFVREPQNLGTNVPKQVIYSCVNFCPHPSYQKHTEQSGGATVTARVWTRP